MLLFATLGGSGGMSKTVQRQILSNFKHNPAGTWLHCLQNIVENINMGMVINVLNAAEVCNFGRQATFICVGGFLD